MGERFNKLRFCIFIILFVLFIPPLVEAKTADEWYNEGIELGQAGKFVEAIEAYDKAIAIDPYYKNAWINKGNSFDELGEHKKAIEAYDKAIAIDPYIKEAWFNKGLAFTNLGEYDKAIEAFDKAIAIDPYYKEAWNNKGMVFMYMGEYDKSIEAFDTIISIYPDEIYLKQNRNLAKIEPWLFLGGIAFFIVIGIIIVQNIRYNRNNNSNNVNTEYNINKWKIFGYVIITWFVLSSLVKISAIIFSTYPIDTDIIVWAWIPLLFGIVMAYRLKKNIELVYAFIIYFMVIVLVMSLFKILN